jgi:hypothetical protein
VPVNTPENIPGGNIISSTIASAHSHLSFDPYDLFSEDDEFLTLTNLAETTPGRSDSAAC